MVLALRRDVDCSSAEWVFFSLLRGMRNQGTKQMTRVTAMI